MTGPAGHGEQFIVRVVRHTAHDTVTEFIGPFADADEAVAFADEFPEAYVERLESVAMTETPTPDEIARWAALAEGATPGPWIVKKAEWVIAVEEDGAPAVGQVNVPADAEFIAAARTAVPRLLALVAAQAEQNAELRGEVRCGSCTYIVEQITAERDAARAELSALRATDEYQRWARAVTWRDAVKRVQALCDEAERTPRGITINGTKFPALVATTDVRAALEGGAAT